MKSQRKRLSIVAVCTAIVLLGLLGVPALVAAQEAGQTDSPADTATTVAAEFGAAYRAIIVGNLDIQSARTSLDRAADDRYGEAAVDESTLTVGAVQSWNLESDDDTDGTDTQGSVSVSIPVVDRLSLTSSVAVSEDDLSGAAGIEFAPFVSNADERTAEESYLNAVRADTATTISVAIETESALFNSMYLDHNIAYLEHALTIQNALLASVEGEYAIGEATYTELYDAESNRDSARNARIDGMRERLAARQTLLNLAAALDTEPTVPQMPLEELTSFLRNVIAAKEVAIGEKEGSPLWSAALEAEEIALWAQEAEYDDTPLFRPSLTLGAETTVDRYGSSESSAFAVSASLTISPQQWKREERMELSEDIVETRMRSAAETRALELELELSRELVEIAEQAVITAERDLANAIDSLDEIDVLVGFGERTELERQQAELTVEYRKLRVSAALIEHNDALSNVISLYGDVWEY
jgi:outer membrane protein TolC